MKNHKIRFSQIEGYFIRFKPSNYFCKFIGSNGNKVVGIPVWTIYICIITFEKSFYRV